MEGIMATVDRLINDLNGEDPAGARMYMEKLGRTEVRGGECI